MKGLVVKMVVGVGSVIQNVNADIPVIHLAFFLMATNAVQAGEVFLPSKLHHFVQKGKFLPGKIPLVSH